MNRQINKKIFTNIYIIYSIVFIITAALVFAPFIYERKSLIWVGEAKDGLYQVYNSLNYWGQYLRNIIYSIIFKQEYSIPMMDFKIGMGYDILTTLNYYAIGDPLTLMAVFFKPSQIEYLYNGLIILRYYLVGLSFLAYSSYRKQPKLGRIVGAFTYCFCGFALFAGVRHPYFLNPMIYLPLLCIGIEKIISCRPAKLFSLIVALSAVSNYYFFYMLTIICFLYALARYLDVYKGAYKNTILSILFKGIGYYLLGLALACVLFLPAVIAFTGTARVDTETFYVNSPWLYSLSYYFKWLLSFCSYPFSPGSWCFLSFIPYSALGILLLFKDKHYVSEKILFTAMTIMLLVPFIGHVMNGFSYVSNRWSFGYAFIIAIITAQTMDKLLKESYKKTILLLCISILILFIVIISKEIKKFALYSGFINVTLSLTFLLIAQFWYAHKKNLSCNIILASCILIITFNAFLLYAPGRISTNYVAEFLPFGTALKTVESAPETKLLKVDDKSFYRVDSTDLTTSNRNMVLGINGTNAFFSIVSKYTTEYFLNLEYDNLMAPHRFATLDGRAGMTALASVKYYALGNDWTYPFGFLASAEENLLINQYYLPIAYTYDTILPKRQWDGLNGIQREQAMLQAVYLDNNEGLPTAPINYTEQSLSYQITDSKNLVYDVENNIVDVLKDNGTLTLRFNAAKNSETYLRFNGLDINDSGNDALTIKADCGKLKKKIYPKAQKYNWYVDRKDYLVNLGYGLEGTRSCTITFTEKGRYQLNNLELYALSMDEFPTYINALKETSLEDIHISGNKINAAISLKSPKIVCFSIPYSEGWSATVNGKKETLQRANIMYMALTLKEGEYNIQLRYRTPGLKAGAAVSLIACLVFFVLSKIQKKRNLF